MSDTSRSPADGNVLFEETLDLRDEKGARSLIRISKKLLLFLIVITLASIGLVVVVSVGGLVSAVGGIDVALSIVEGIRSEQPLAFVVIIFMGLLFVGYSIFLIFGLVLQMNREFDKKVHIRVTDNGVSVRREGSSYWQSSGVEIPFDAITSVEYLDQDESSTRLELGDLRSKQFFAGRSQNWIRIERETGPAVYVGSDRHFELAELIARHARTVKNAEPF